MHRQFKPADPRPPRTEQPYSLGVPLSQITPGQLLHEGIVFTSLHEILAGRPEFYATLRICSPSKGGAISHPRLFLSRIRPDRFLFAATLTVRLLNEPGCLEKAAAAIRDVGFNVYDIEPRPHTHHFTLVLRLIAHELAGGQNTALSHVVEKAHREQEATRAKSALGELLADLESTLRRQHAATPFLYANSDHRDIEFRRAIRLQRAWVDLVDSTVTEFHYDKQQRIARPVNQEAFVHTLSAIEEHSGIAVPAMAFPIYYADEGHIEIDISQTAEELTSSVDRVTGEFRDILAETEIISAGDTVVQQQPRSDESQKEVIIPHYPSHPGLASRELDQPANLPANFREGQPAFTTPLSSLASSRKMILAFKTTLECERAIDAIWDAKSPIFRIPRDYVGERGIVVPRDALPYFAAISPRLSFDVVDYTPAYHSLGL